MRMSNNLSFNINLIVAHKLEATPLIRHFKLRALTQRPYQVFTNGQGLRLIISGMGVRNTVSAVKYISEYQSCEPYLKEGWVNAGIAGHKTADLGICFLANKILHQETGEVYYPSLHMGIKSTEMLITVDKPERSYTQEAAYDMEAAGFFKSAAECSEIELISTVKVVSDNESNSIDAITEGLINDLMLETIDFLESVIDEFKERLNTLNRILILEQDCMDLTRNLHFSVSQHHQFRKYCQRYHALGKEDELDAILRIKQNSARVLLHKLSDALVIQDH